MATYTSKLKWAWQALFLSLTLIILKVETTFEDFQMMLELFFDFSAVSDFQRSVWSVPSISVAVLDLVWWAVTSSMKI